MTKNSIGQKALVLISLSFILSVASTLSFVFINSILLATIFGCACAGLYSISLLCSANKLYYLVIPASVLCAFLISFSAFTTVMAFVPFIIGIIVSNYARKKGMKTEAVLLCDLALFVVLIIGILASVYFETGKINVQYFVDSFNAVFDSIRENMIDVLQQAKIYDIYSKIYDMGKYTEEEFITVIVDEVIFVTKAISPSMIFLVLSIYSMLSVQFHVWVAKLSKIELAVPNGKWILVPSSVSCYVFCGSLIAYILTSGFLSTGNVGTVIEMAALNLLLMLVCPFTACGVRSIKARLKVPEKARSGRLVMILSIILILFNFIYGILFVALQGATDMIVYYKKLKMWKMNNKPEE